jgi:ATP-dependent DNA ligase
MNDEPAGRAVACGEDGIALFERIRYRRHDASAFMWAFDIIELNGDDLRRAPLEGRKAALEKLLARAGCSPDRPKPGRGNCGGCAGKNHAECLARARRGVTS